MPPAEILLLPPPTRRRLSPRSTRMGPHRRWSTLPNDVGRLVVEGILQDKPHIFTHPAPVAQLQARLDALLAVHPQPAAR